MSWYKNPSISNPNISETPKRETSFIQVPDSSPHGENNESPVSIIPPSRTLKIEGKDLNSINSMREKYSIDAIGAGNNKVDEIEEKRKQAQAKLNRLLNHKNYPLVEKAFPYLEQKQILPAFNKFKGNLREITNYLQETYNKTEILKQKEKVKKEKEQEAKENEIRLKEQQIIQLDSPDSSPVKSNRPVLLDSSPLNPNDNLSVTSSKVQLKKPKISILDKYSYRPKESIKPVEIPEEAPRPKRRRLVRGQKLYGYEDDDMIVPDAEELEKAEERIAQNKAKKIDLTFAAVTSNKKKEIISLSDEEEDKLSDDQFDSGMEESDDNNYTNFSLLDQKVLDFLNTASIQDIVGITSIQPSVVEVLISKRPFNSLADISESNFDKDSNTKNVSKRKKLIGQKIIENTENSLRGYQAVDSLIKKCAEYGDLIEAKIKKWGVSVTGKKGELEVVDIDVEDENTPVPDSENDEDEDVMIIHHNRRGNPHSYLKTKPKLLSESLELKNYQQVGLNWLNLLYQNKLSCILADEMGLGKTCQVIAFMAYLKELDPHCGPHLVVVPSSTLENWLREFQKFCPHFKVQAYYGSQKEREELRVYLSGVDFDVMVTTYNLATGNKYDFNFLKHIGFNVVVYDEGHMLKNSQSERYIKLMRLRAQFRLLLTGTPLQNNLKELVSLLAFILPSIFDEKKDDLHGLFSQKVKTTDNDEDFNPLLSQQAISKAKTMMTPFVLRRKKDQVLQHLPQKHHKTEYCDLTLSQRKLYDTQIVEAKAARAERERRKSLKGAEAELAKKQPMPSSTNIMMQLRKASLHPLLFRSIYNDKKLKSMAKAIMKEPQYLEANEKFIYEDMQVMSDFELNKLCSQFPLSLKKFQLKSEEWMNSGKIKKLQEILPSMIVKGDRILMFSLFTQVLDILEKVLSDMNISFLRLDGSTAVETRQDMIDQFYEDSSIPVFLLSTKAGGFGINLVCANIVIIFDQSFNPHDDRQAEDRAHRVGQTKEVNVIRLITKDTIEESILQLAENKLALDKSISSEDGNEKLLEEKTADMFERILFEK